MKAFCLEPVFAAKYITMKTTISTEVIDCEVVRPNIIWVFFRIERKGYDYYYMIYDR